MFGIEPAEEDDSHRFKWEARQRRLHRLRTERQLILRSTPKPEEPIRGKCYKSDMQLIVLQASTNIYQLGVEGVTQSRMI